MTPVVYREYLAALIHALRDKFGPRYWNYIGPALEVEEQRCVSGVLCWASDPPMEWEWEYDGGPTEDAGLEAAGLAQDISDLSEYP